MLVGLVEGPRPTHTEPLQSSRAAFPHEAEPITEALHGLGRAQQVLFKLELSAPTRPARENRIVTKGPQFTLVGSSQKHDSSRHISKLKNNSATCLPTTLHFVRPTGVGRHHNLHSSGPIYRANMNTAAFLFLHLWLSESTPPEAVKTNTVSHCFWSHEKIPEKFKKRKI